MTSKVFVVDRQMFDEHCPMTGTALCHLSGLTDTIFLGPVVQSIVSLTSSLRGRLVKCFTTL